MSRRRRTEEMTACRSCPARRPHARERRALAHAPMTRSRASSSTSSPGARRRDETRGTRRDAYLAGLELCSLPDIATDLVVDPDVRGHSPAQLSEWTQARAGSFVDETSRSPVQPDRADRCARIAAEFVFPVGDRVDLGRPVARQTVAVAAQIRDAAVIPPRSRAFPLVRIGHASLLRLLPRDAMLATVRLRHVI